MATMLGGTSAEQEVLLRGGIVLLAIVILGVAVLWLRRYLRGQTGAQAKGDLSVEEVEALHEAGHITAEEFKALRLKALGLDKPADKSDNSRLSDGTSGVDENKAKEDPDRTSR